MPPSPSPVLPKITAYGNTLNFEHKFDDFLRCSLKSGKGFPVRGEVTKKTYVWYVSKAFLNTILKYPPLVFFIKIHIWHKGFYEKMGTGTKRGDNFSVAGVFFTNKIYKNECLFMKKIFFQVLSKGSFFLTCLKHAESIVAVFPRGPKRGYPTMTTSTITARKKGDPQHMLRENLIFIWGLWNIVLARIIFSKNEMLGKYYFWKTSMFETLSTD